MVRKTDCRGMKMKLSEVRGIARQHHVKPAGLNKSDLIHEIQCSEGNFDCYATACSGYCDQMDCLWREDCLSEARKMAH